MIIRWTLIWLNWSVATINATLQLLDIYRQCIRVTKYLDSLFNYDMDNENKYAAIISQKSSKPVCLRKEHT